MKRFQALSMVVALCLSGCVFRGKQQAKVTAPPPVPAAPVPPQPPPQPLSIPQTQTQLPPKQTISPEALATIQFGAQTTEPEASSGATNHTSRPAGPVAGRRSEPAAPAPVPQPAAGAPTPPPAETETRGTVEEIVSASELKRLQDSVAARKSEIHKVLDFTEKRKLSREEASVVARIKSFLQQSDDAEKRGDWRQADALADRAQVLAKELSSGNQ
jgi:hypothetical protein